MKLLISVFCLLAAIAVNAQDTGDKNAIKLNPLSLIFATGNVAYERAVSENSSIQLGFFYTGVSIEDLKYTGFGITPEYRIYFAGNKHVFNGVYAGPFVRFQSFEITDKISNGKADYSSFGGGAIIGWEKTWNSGFVLDIFAGPQYNKGDIKPTSGSGQFDVAGSIDGFGIRSGITLGFAF
jgi:hypothetical protein